MQLPKGDATSNVGGKAVGPPALGSGQSGLVDSVRSANVTASWLLLVRAAVWNAAGPIMKACRI